MNSPPTPKTRSFSRGALLWLIGVSAACLAISSAGLIASFLIASDPLPPADAIYLLGGDPEVRRSYAAGLFRRGFAPRILVPADRAPTPTLSPVPDDATRILLESVVWRPGSRHGEGFHVSLPLPNQHYSVYLYLVENYQSHFRAVDVKLEGVVQATRIGDLPLGAWRRYGPYDAAVNDGVLDLRILHSGKGDPALAGMAVYSHAAGGRRFVRGLNFGGAAVRIGSEDFESVADASTDVKVSDAHFLDAGLPSRLGSAAHLRNLGVPADAIVEIGDPGSIRSTYDEAKALEAFLEREPMGRLIVVTSPFHTRRSRSTIQKALLKRETQIFMAPAPHPVENTHGWWLSRTAAASLLAEYVKLVYYFLAH